MRLIDADNLISVCEILADKCDDKRAFEQAIWIAKDAPTVDAVQVVRCKDCKYFGGAFWCRWYECGTGGDGYCHHGEGEDDV